ncbi:MAG: hypothetical protein KDK89_15940 [Alphaproteobacteria bacterium]|nr:hypothetical protein [Alphaproteobacteria bacterium]
MVSLAAVPDPMQALPTELEAVFDTVVPYKTHYIADLEVPFSRYMTRHHRRYVGKALAHITIEHAARPVVHADEWALLYSHLVTRRGIAGLRAFDPHSLGLQLAVPGCHYFRARRDDQTVGALVCYLDRGVAYAHLISTTPLGQTMLAQYALYWQAIEYFRGHARWFALGGTAGSEEPETGGLAFFKRGWATGSCVAYFCSKILDLETYENLVARYGAAAGGFFPAYRHGGF